MVNEKLSIYSSIDSLYVSILKGATLRNSKGDMSNLDLLTIKAKQQQVKSKLSEIRNSQQSSLAKLKALMGYDSLFVVATHILVLPLEEKAIELSPFYLWLKSQEALGIANVGVARNMLMPDISFSYFMGTNSYDNAKKYHGFEAGISIPIFFNAQKAKIKASRIALCATQNLTQYEVELLKVKQKELMGMHLQLREQIEYFNQSGSKLYSEIVRTAKLSFEKGEIDFVKFATSTEAALEIRLGYLSNLLEYTKVTLELNYISK